MIGIQPTTNKKTFAGSRWRRRWAHHIYRSHRNASNTSADFPSTANPSRNIPTTLGLYSALDPNAIQLQRHQHVSINPSSIAPIVQTPSQHSQTNKSLRTWRQLRLPATRSRRRHFDTQTQWVNQFIKKRHFLSSSNLSPLHSTIKMRARHTWMSADIPNASTTATNYVSVDNLQMLQTARLVCSGQQQQQFAPSTDSAKLAHSTVGQTLTQSCSNLKSAIPCTPSISIVPQSNSPGALRVRTHFINPPLRVVKSFHGKTSFGHNVEVDTVRDLRLMSTSNDGVVESTDKTWINCDFKFLWKGVYDILANILKSMHDCDQ